ncbi:hypothetical protein V8F06_007105 [Rhypophila decipiens]
MTTRINRAVDVELGLPGNTPPESPNPIRHPALETARKIYLWWQSRTAAVEPQNQNHGNSNSGNSAKQIEDYPPGYPRFSALLSAHKSFQVFRSFSTVRTRLILLAQDRVAILEHKLEGLDRNEESPLFLACSRKDKNPARRAVLSELQEALATYDDLLRRSHEVLSLEPPHPFHVSSLQNWEAGNACVARDEVAFLHNTLDLLSLSGKDDRVMSWIEQRLSLLKFLHRGRRSNISRDDHVHILPQHYTRGITRAVVAPPIILLLMVPVAICIVVHNLYIRLGVVAIADSVFLAALANLTEATPVDLAVAGATYATVLIVFISNPDGAPP